MKTRMKVTLFLICICAGLFLLRGSRSSKPAPSVSEALPATQTADTAHDSVNDAPVAQPQRVSAPVMAESAERLDPRPFQTGIAKWQSFQGDLYMRQSRQALVTELAKDQRNVVFSEAITSDVGQAAQLFGEQQAEARVLAMQVLIEAAKTEGPERLERLAREVANQVAAGQTAKGRTVDLTDLIEGWIKTVGPEHLKENPHLLRDRLVIKYSLLVPYLRAFEYVYGRDYNHPNFPVRRAFEEGLDHES